MVNGGPIAVRADSDTAIGILTIVGDFTMNGGTHRCGIDASSNKADVINCSAIATISSKAVVDPFVMNAPGILAAGDVYNIVKVGTLAGTNFTSDDG